MPKEMDAIYIRSLFSASDRALIGSRTSRRCATGRLTRVAGDRRCPAAESSVAVQMIVCPSVPTCYVTWQRWPHKQPAASFLVRHICSSRIQRFHAGAKSRPRKQPSPGRQCAFVSPAMFNREFLRRFLWCLKPPK